PCAAENRGSPSGMVGCSAVAGLLRVGAWFRVYPASSNGSHIVPDQPWCTGFPQAAGGDASRVAPLVSGVASAVTPLERALIDLVRDAHDAPALLTPTDLARLRAIAGDDALDSLLVLCAFHIITRNRGPARRPARGLPPALRRVE